MTDDLFPAGSVARRIDRELFVLLGGPTALLLQVAHPLVAAGVDEHSDFRRDPLGRLHRTLDTTLSIMFGTREDADRMLRRIDLRHRSVEGVTSDGRPYRARDARLLLWVMTTLVLTALRLYELVRGPLSRAERDRYWTESLPIAVALGVPRPLLPPDLEGLVAYEREMLATEVLPDEVSRSLARKILRPLAWIPAPLHWPLDALTAGLLPARVRDAYGLRWRTRDRLMFRATVVALRMIRGVVPDRLAIVPHARRWEARRAR